MNIHEYQAKEILQSFNVPIPVGFMVTSTKGIQSKIHKLLKSDIFVVKAQIHAGGRGKAGGIKLAKSAKEAEDFTKSILNTTLFTQQTEKKGKKVKKVYIEEGMNLKKEYYLSIIIDPKFSKPVLIFSSEGGIDIEQVAKNTPTKIIKFDINYTSSLINFDHVRLNEYFNLNSEQIKKIIQIAQNMYNAFIATDASQIEINPLGETVSGDFFALDVKMNFDDNALYRHPEIIKLRDYDEEIKEEIEALKYGLNYIKMNGNIGCMVNGAGLAMATMDMIKLYGGEPANFLDVGGKANIETINQAFKIILSDNNIKGILVNIFGGILRCDTIANGILEATKKINIQIPLVVRLLGTNFQEGKTILKKSKLNIIIANKLDEATKKIVNEVNKQCLF